MCTKTERDYVQQFVDRISDLLQASLSREFWHEDQQKCSCCHAGKWAIWRCIDCSLARPICRQCIREQHQNSPFHRIECWTGFHFRRAALWEVGTYILVPHHVGLGICSPLQIRMDLLEGRQLDHDAEEQAKVSAIQSAKGKGKVPSSCSAFASATTTSHSDDVEMGDGSMENRGGSWQEDQVADADFFAWLNKYHDAEAGHGAEPLLDFEGADDDSGEVAEADIQGFDQYLGPSDPMLAEGSPASAPESTDGRANLGTADTGNGMDDYNLQPDRPTADALNNSYVRVVHTNGIHHLAMLTCSCHGAENIPLDLVASCLMPASFTRIRTLFTMGLLDYFRLCNLELKASAYQFYQLIRRLTLPLGQSEIVNMYHEFRRMSRLWRWMKKLKWAGFGHNARDPLKPEAGSLGNFCPTCPQPGINLPMNWKDDGNR